MVNKRFWVPCVLAVAVGYWLYQPLPQGIAEPWKLRLFLGTTRIMNYVINGGCKVGLWVGPNVTQRLTKMGVIWKSGPLGDLDPRVETRDVDFAGVPVRFYRPKGTGDTQLPAMLYFHGGGWVLFSVDNYDLLASRIAAEANIVVISVEYRLAPEHVFPAAAHDCINATIHLIQNAAKYNVDRDRIGVAGDSAGGNLAAAVTGHLRSTGDFQPIKFQALIYPALQSLDFRLPSYMTCGDFTPEILSRTTMVKFWLKYYQGSTVDTDKFLSNAHRSSGILSRFSGYVNAKDLPSKYHSQIPEEEAVTTDPAVAEKFERFLSDELANPLLAHSLAHTPPSFVLTAEFDVLRDDGLLYVHRLRQDKVPVTHQHYDSGYHGFVSLMNTPVEPAIARQAVADLVNFVKSQGF